MLHSISCLCTKVVQQVHINPSSDGELNLCHCTECQAVSGQICTSYYPIHGKPLLENLLKYQQSDTLSRYFCGTCGSHAFAHSTHDSKYFVAAGLLDRPPQTKGLQHWGADDTKDGGLTSFLPGSSADKTRACWLNSQTSSQNITSAQFLGAVQDSSQLLARCHCGGVELYITRPDSTSEELWSHWPDIIIPYNSGVSAENEEDVKWWLCAQKTKYMAGTCACRTCRLASGFPIQTWAFIPKSNILTAQKLPLAYEVGTLKRFESSPAVYREFCNRCGASVFWHCDKRPQLIDVSVGLLQAGSGSRAEEWLEWATQRTSFAEMAVDESLIQQLEDGLKVWRQQS
ncbi:Mss4-like protein [Aspergillus heterothallicus]